MGVQLDPVVEAAKGTPLLGTPTNAREDDRAVQLDGNILVSTEDLRCHLVGGIAEDLAELDRRGSNRLAI